MKHDGTAGTHLSGAVEARHMEHRGTHKMHGHDLISFMFLFFYQAEVKLTIRSAAP